MKKVLKQFNKTATTSVAIALVSLVIGISVNIVVAATWQDPAASPPNLGDLEPPLNSSMSGQEKTGGLYVATEGSNLRVGSDVGGSTLVVVGNSSFVGNTAVDSLSASANADVDFTNTGSATINNDLTVHNELLRIDDVSDHIFINSSTASGLVTVNAEDEPGIDIENDSLTGYAVWGINVGAGGTGIFGNGRDYGVSSNSTAGYSVLADASTSGVGGLYARAGDMRYGLVGRGLYGVVGLDNTEDINNPIFSGSAGTLAGLFEGSVDIVPSAGGNAGLAVDSDTFVINSLTNKVGVGTDNPSTRLHITGVDDLPAMYTLTGTNTVIDGYGDPTQTVTGVYGESGTVTYNGGNTGWNFGVFGQAGNPGVGRSVGVGGIGDSGGGLETFAGRFFGDTMMNGPVTVGRIKSYLSGGILEVSDDIIGNNDLNIAGDTNNDINLTGTNNGINLTGNINGDGDITYMGKLNMTGGLPALHSSVYAACNVTPGNYAEGTMYVCVYCVHEYGQRYYIMMARMHREWVNIGYTKGELCSGDPWEPEIPSQYKD